MNDSHEQEANGLFIYLFIYLFVALFIYLTIFYLLT